MYHFYVVRRERRHKKPIVTPHRDLDKATAHSWLVGGLVSTKMPPFFKYIGSGEDHAFW
jgi:hypothetical protein